MSMITGCPACGTMFKVVADQLKISDGWVRCGHCAEIFDAATHMQPATPATPVETAAALSDEPVIDVEARLLDRDVPAAQPPSPADTEPDELAPPPPAFKPSEPALTPWEAPSGFGPSSQPADESSYLPVHLVRAEADAADAAAARIDAPDDEEEATDDDLPLEDVTFVREARRKALWRRPVVRFALVLVLLALAGLLALQVALQERDRLASLQPGALPLLQRLCEPLGCRIGPPRRIDAIAIDSSGFTKLRPDTYRLTVTLKNQAPLPVAMPSLELTLTDSQDQPVMRRVLTPGEIGAPAETIASSADWSTSVAIAVSGAGAGRIAGYRLLAFYP
jgi:predicted Zn finger-like uncharacterized protein